MILGFHTGPALDHQGADALVFMRTLIEVGAAIYQEQIGFGGSHHKAFLPVDHEMIALPVHDARQRQVTQAGAPRLRHPEKHLHGHGFPTAG